MKLALAIALSSAWLLTAAEPLQTRAFKLDSINFGEAKHDSGIKKLMNATGIEFPAANSQRQDTRGYFYAESSKLLTVRATAAELDKIEKALHATSKPPPQVLLESNFVEMDREVLGGLSGKPAVDEQTNGPVILGIMTTPQFRANIQALENRTGVDLLTAPTVKTISGRQARLQVEGVNRNPFFQTPPPRPRRATPDSPITPTVPEK